MRVNPPSLTLITDTRRYSGESFFEACDQAFANGVDTILVREKELTSAKLLALASRLRELTRKHRARLIIHTQADIAHAVNADGVHVASSDISTIPAIRSWLSNSDMSISASCHNAEELLQAEQAGADFAMLAPVFPTGSHPGAPSLGIKAFQTLAAQAGIPVVALGGITLENYQQLASSDLAIISAILGAENSGKAANILSSGQHLMRR
jgi:thiamine-phosphate diphosphorylase